uniref:Serine /threonine specific protein phosphatase n=1 Tax=Pyrodictium abyssi TaxID=54256 RepID=O08367_9CREN|nr:serine /threonine specific protein phosphatase [Pyrodictium abyssi]
MQRELPRLLEDAVEVLRRRGPVVRLGAGSVLVAGDTHGYPEVSRWVLGLADELGVDAVVFLGDYVDRGPRGVENLSLLVERLLAEPGRVVLLRGNHESPSMNLYYGFRGEFAAKVGVEHLDILHGFYSCLPYAALMGRVLLVHGGVPCRECQGGPEEPLRLGEIEERLRGLFCRRWLLEWGDSVAVQLLWNDPRGELDWFAPSLRGPGIYYYGRLAWKGFLEANGLELIVRAHEAVDAHHVWTSSGRPVHGLEHGYTMGLEELRGSVVTVFSSLYHGAGAGALLLREGEVVFLRYPGGAQGL